MDTTGLPHRPGADPARTAGDVRRLARGSALKFAGSVSYAVLSFLLVVLITRSLGRGGSGAFFEGVALFLILSNAAELGADTGVVRFLSAARARRETGELRATLSVALIPVAVVGAVLGLALVLAAPTLAEALASPARQEAVAEYFRALGFFVPLSAIETVVVSATRGFGSILPLVLVTNVAQPILRLALVAVAVAAGAGAALIAVAWGFPIALGLTAMFVVLFRLLHKAERRAAEGRPPRSEPPPQARPWLRVAAEFWRFAIPRAGAAILATLVTWLDTLLVGALDSTAAAGVYTAASRFSLVGFAFLGAVLIVISPQVGGFLATAQLDRARVVFRTATAWLILATWPIYLLLAIFAPTILRLFGAGFGAGAPALAIMSIAMLVNMGTGPVTTVLLMGGRSGWNLANSVGALVLNVGLNLLLIPRLGITGAAIAWAATIVGANLAAVVQVRLLVGLDPFGRAWAMAAAMTVACFGVVGVVCRWLLGPTVPALMLAVAGGLVVYLVCLVRLRGPLRVDEFLSALVRPRAAPVRAGAAGADPADQDVDLPSLPGAG
jgi:O-antigen/teichoic acid export membrane protein